MKLYLLMAVSCLATSMAFSQVNDEMPAVVSALDHTPPAKLDVIINGQSNYVAVVRVTKEAYVQQVQQAVQAAFAGQQKTIDVNLIFVHAGKDSIRNINLLNGSFEPVLIKKLKAISWITPQEISPNDAVLTHDVTVHLEAGKVDPAQSSYEISSGGKDYPSVPAGIEQLKLDIKQYLVKNKVNLATLKGKNSTIEIYVGADNKLEEAYISSTTNKKVEALILDYIKKVPVWEAGFKDGKTARTQNYISIDF